MHYILRLRVAREGKRSRVRKKVRWKDVLKKIAWITWPHLASVHNQYNSGNMRLRYQGSCKFWFEATCNYVIVEEP